MEDFHIILIVFFCVIIAALLVYAIYRRFKKNVKKGGRQVIGGSLFGFLTDVFGRSSSLDTSSTLDESSRERMGGSSSSISSAEIEQLKKELYKEIMNNLDTSDDVIVQPSISYPNFIGYWKNTKSFGIKGSNEEYFDSNSILESNRPSKTGNSFSKSLSLANTRGHKFMALKRDCHSDSQKNKKCKLEGGEMLSFNQLNYSNKFEYNYATPSLDQPDKNSGCSKEICKKQFELDHELWAVYQLYK